MINKNKEFNNNVFNELYNLKDQIEYIESSIKVNYQFILGSRYFSEEIYNKYIMEIEKRNTNKCIINIAVLSEKFINKNLNKIDWDYILESQKLSEDFLEEFIDNSTNNQKILISAYQKLSEKFIKKHLENLSLSNILKNQKMSEDFLGEFIENSTNSQKFLISTNQKLSEEFFLKHESRFDWEYIMNNQKISIKVLKDKVSMITPSYIKNNKISEKEIINIIENNHFNIELKDIFLKLKMSEEFIEKYSNKSNWKIISQNQVLSEEFIERHIKDIDMREIVSNQVLSEEFIERHIKDIDMISVGIHQVLSEKFIIKYENKFVWDDIEKHQVLSEEFIERHINGTYIKICKYQTLSEEFILRNSNKISLTYLYENKNFILTTKISKEYHKEINFNQCSKYLNMTDEVISNYINNINWHELINNKKIDINILRKFKSKIKIEQLYCKMNNKKYKNIEKLYLLERIFEENLNKLIPIFDISELDELKLKCDKLNINFYSNKNKNYQELLINIKKKEKVNKIKKIKKSLIKKSNARKKKRERKKKLRIKRNELINNKNIDINEIYF